MPFIIEKWPKYGKEIRSGDDRNSAKKDRQETQR